jgi:hypothetical protein
MAARDCADLVIEVIDETVVCPKIVVHDQAPRGGGELC